MSTVASEVRQRARSARDPRWIVFGAPVAAFIFVGMAPVFGQTRVIFGLVAAALVVLLSRYPGPALIALVWFLPLQIPLQSWIYRQGAPGDIIRSAGTIKEGLAAAVLVAAIRELAARRSRIDWVDKMVLAFVGALLVYLLLPMVVSTAGTFPGIGTRALGFRLNAGFLLVFFAARHAPIDARWRRRIVASILAITGLLALIGLYQFLRPASFTDIILYDLGIPTYNLEALQTPLAEVVQLVRWTTARPVRVGSLMVGPFDFADYMLIPGGLLLARLARRGARTLDMVLLAAVGAAIFASQTRANIAALGVMLLLALAPGGKRALASRMRIVAIAALAAVALIPSLASSRLGGAEESAASSEGHLNEIQFGLEVLKTHPLGLGLGTAPAVAVRAEGTPLVISDNSLLQVGNELGVAMMIFFIVIVGAVVVRLGQAARDGPDDDLATGARLAIVGLFLAGQLHHVFQTFSISWTVWAAAGLGLAHLSRVRSSSEDADVSGGYDRALAARV
jgi:hypothetical protein